MVDWHQTAAESAADISLPPGRVSPLNVDHCFPLGAVTIHDRGTAL